MTRAEARETGLKHFFTGKPCRRGHLSERLASTGNCCACNTEYTREWEANNPERTREKHARNYQASRGRRSAAARLRYLKDPQKFSDSSRRWREKNPHKHLAACVARSRRVTLATPPWADLGEIEAVYERAREMTEETGVPHEVDHIVAIKAVDPSSGTHVCCGLHVPANLQVLTRARNRSKSNRFSGDCVTGWGGPSLGPGLILGRQNKN